MVNHKKQILVVGGGFGGVKTADLLSKRNDASVTLLSDKKDFWYFPTMYHTATGAPEDLTSIPLKRIFEDKNVKLIIGKAKKLNRETKELILEDGSKLKYDYLVLSLGVVTNYFGIEGLEKHSFGVKTIDEANQLKKHLHQQLVDDGEPDLRYVVVGGGPTGIETAGQIKKFLNHIIKRHNLPKKPIHVELVESSPRLLPRMHQSAGRLIARRLRQLGVKLHLGSTVAGATAKTLQVDGKNLETETIIWTAGQANNSFYEENNFSLSKRHKVIVDDFLRAEENIYVIGDNAETEYSGLAQTAIYDANFVAIDIAKRIEQKRRLSYMPQKPAYIIPAGERWAYVEWNKIKLHGFWGWLLREAGNLIGFLEITRPIDAGEQWLKEFKADYKCNVCNQ